MSIITVINKEVIKEDTYRQGGILVCYLDNEQERVNECILNSLENAGYRVHTLEINLENCCDLHFLFDAHEKIKNAACGIFVFSHNLDEDIYLICRQTFYYVMGMMGGKKKNIYPFSLSNEPGEINNLLKGTPISDLHGINEVEKLLVKLKIPREIYFKDPELNKLVMKRIKRVKITATLSIKRDTMKWIWEHGWKKEKKKFNDELKTMIDELYEGLRVGASIIKFGKYSTIRQNPFIPYFAESELLYIDSPAQYDKGILPKPIEDFEFYSRYGKSNANIATTIRLEFIIPVHDILGTAFKPFVMIKSKKYKWKKEHLNIILTNHDSNNHCIKVNEGIDEKVYFLLPMTTTNHGQEIDAMYGTDCNTLFPQ